MQRVRIDLFEKPYKYHADSRDNWYYVLPTLLIRIMPCSYIIVDNKKHLQQLNISFMLRFLNFAWEFMSITICTKYNDVSPFDD